jgi:hypothetical protein
MTQEQIFNENEFGHDRSVTRCGLQVKAFYNSEEDRTAANATTRQN